MFDYADHKQILAHFPQQVSQDIVNFATNEALLWSRYIFTWRKGKQQFGYCTHCKKEFKCHGLRHNQHSICPECQSKCRIRASGISRKYMIDEVYFVYYEKSVVNPHAIVARGYYAVRDYRFDYRQTETQFLTKALYLFEPGNCKMLHRYAYYSTERGMCSVGHWTLAKKVFSLGDQSSHSSINDYCSFKSIEKAVKDSPFRFSTWQQYWKGDMVRFFGLYAKYPCIEYLTKLGFRDLVEAKLEGYETFSAVNWRGKTPLQVLKLSKQDLNEIRELKISIGPLALRLFQISKKDHSNLSFAEIYDILQHYVSNLKDLQKILAYTTLRKVYSYIKKQFSRKDARKHYFAPREVLITWRDYIKDCQQLELDLSQEHVLFPGDLYAAHQNTITQIKVQADALLNSKILKRASELELYCFEHDGLFIRPATSSDELIAEG